MMARKCMISVKNVIQLTGNLWGLKPQENEEELR